MEQSKRLNKKNIEDILALTPMQEGMLFHYLEDPRSENYFEQLCLDIEGKIDAAIFEEAWNAVIEANEMLRVVFRWENVEKPIQIILKKHSIKPLQYGLSKENPAPEEPHPGSIAKSLEAIKANDRKIKFDLNDVPFRVTLCKIEDEKYTIIISNHHILYDGWSNAIILKEFFAAYNDIAKGNGYKRKSKTQFKEYVKGILNRDVKGEETFWRDYLEGFKEPVELSLKRKTNENELSSIGDYRSTISKEMKAEIETFIRSRKITLASLLYCAWGLLLQKYNIVNDILFGITVSGRWAKIPGIESIVGLFINTVPMRVQITPDENVSTLLGRIDESLKAREDYNAASLADIKGYSDIGNTQELFDTLFIMRNYPLYNLSAGDGGPISLRSYTMDEMTNYDLSIAVEVFDEIKFIYNYKTAAFVDIEAIARLANRFNSFIKSIIENPGSLLSELSIPESLTFPPLLPCRSPNDTLPQAPKELACSYHQERLWFIDTFEAGNLYEYSPIYHNIPLILELNGTLVPGTLEKSIQHVIMSHDSLRTQIITKNNVPYQYVTGTTAFRLDTRDLTGSNDSNIMPGSVKPADWLKAVEEEIERPFFIDREPLIRGKLISVETGKHILILTIHHLVADRFSLGIISREIWSEYEYLQKHGVSQPWQSPVQYSDFARWQREFPESINETLLLYWKRALNGKLQALEIPSDHPRSAIHTFHAVELPVTITGKTYEMVMSVARETQVTPFIILLAAFKALLHRYCGQDEIVVGTSAVNREQPNTETIIGPVANLLTLRSHISGTTSLRQLLPVLQKTVTEAHQHQSLPFDKLVLKLSPDKDMSRTALFDVLFQYDDIPMSILPPAGLSIKPIESNLGWGKYDLNLMIQPHETSFSGIMVYNTDYYNPATISRFLQHYKRMLQCLVQEADREIASHPFITKEEKQRLLRDWNNMDADYPQHVTIRQLFEEQVSRIPDRAALVGAQTGKRMEVSHGRIHVSYRLLNNNADILAARLRRKGVKAGDIIGLAVDRSLELLVSILAILKAEAAYLPMDPSYPAQRIRYMLADSNTAMLLTTRALSAEIDFNNQIIYVDEETQPGSQAQPALPQEQPRRLDSRRNRREDEKPAYIIYTSGTTGRPKGVMISHRNLVRLFFNSKNPFDFSHTDVWTLFHSHCFDFSVWEMYGALLYGGKLIIIPPMTARDTHGFIHVLKEEQVTVLNQTPSAFYNLVNHEVTESRTQLPLRYVIFGGEALTPARLKPWRQRYPSTRLINMFGITETTVHVTFKEITDRDIRENISNIGRPLPTLTTYILDANQQLQPLGVPGELCIGGDGVAMGYLNRPQLTAEKFRFAPFHPSNRLYRSGDLARFTPNGDIQYLGRIDQQVQLRGFRIELGEIENHLLTRPEIKDVVVIDKKDESGDKFLCAYFVPHTETDSAQTETLIQLLRNHLSKILPDYMVPSFFVSIVKIPMTSNGKVDRKQLPAPVQTGPQDTYKAPTDKIENELAKIWTGILKVERVGMNDNFFQLGGHSLKATSLTAKIHRAFNVRMPLSMIFNAPVFHMMSDYIKEAASIEISPIPKVEKADYYALSHSQERIWAQSQSPDASLAYNMTAAYEVEGPWQKDILTKTINTLIERHDSLRTVFPAVEAEPKQKILPPLQIPQDLAFIDLREDPQSKSKAKQLAQSETGYSFDLERGPLFRQRFIRLADNCFILLVSMHHIVSDGVSMEVLLKEFTGLYHQYVNDIEYEPEPLRIRYKDYAAWQRQQLLSGAHKRHEEYWVKQLQEQPPHLQLPTVEKRPEIMSYDGAEKKCSLEPKTTAAFKHLAEQNEATLFMAVLTVIYILLYRLTDQDDIIVGTPATGRDHPDLEGLVGCFLNTVALRVRIDEEETFKTLLAKVKTLVLEAFRHQSYPFDQLTQRLVTRRDIGRHPLFDVLVDMVNFDFSPPDATGESLKLTPFQLENNKSKLDLTIYIVESQGDNSLNFNFEYNTALFKPETIEDMIERFQYLIDSVVLNPGIDIRDLVWEAELVFPPLVPMKRMKEQL